VLARIRALNRLEGVRAALRHALNSLAIAAPAWLKANIQAAWADRYDRRLDDSRLPVGQEQRRAYAEQVGRDGQILPEAVYALESPGWLREVPAVQTLRQVWIQQFYPEARGQLRWRTEAEGIPPSAAFIQ
jgi:transposase